MKRNTTRTCVSCGAFVASDHNDQMCNACTRRAGNAFPGPPDVPTSFWAVEHMVAALQTWHMGKVIAAYRTHPFHYRPLSQELVGSWVERSQSQMSRLESGRPVKNMDTLLLWARTLRIPPNLLWFKVPEADDAPDMGRDGHPDLDDSLGSDGGLHRAFPALDLDELSQLSLGLEDARYFDDVSIGFLRRQLVNCAADDGSAGPKQALPHVLALLATIDRQAGEVRPGVRRDFIVLGTRAAELAGWLYRDLGSDTGAEYWRDRALEWAAEVGDLPMCGYVLLRKSQAAWDRRDASRMLSLADAAQSPTWQLPTRVKAEVAQQQARGHAMLRSSHDVVARKLDEAWDLLTEVQAEDDTDLGAHYDAAMLTLQTAICHSEGGDPSKAVETYGSLLASPAFSERDRGYLLALLALAYQEANEPGEAARRATESVSIARPTASKRTLSELQRLNSRLTPWSGLTQVREFREALVAAS